MKNKISLQFRIKIYWFEFLSVFFPAYGEKKFANELQKIDKRLKELKDV